MSSWLWFLAAASSAVFVALVALVELLAELQRRRDRRDAELWRNRMNRMGGRR
jgi:hypothetical protein